jgi:hypothetical protein
MARARISPKAIDAVIAKVIEGKSVSSICRGDDAPCGRGSFYEFVADNPAYADKYARACRIRSEIHADEIIAFADNSGDDLASIAKARNQIDARKWHMSKMSPKKYSDRIQADISGTIDVVHDISALRERKVQLDAIESGASNPLLLGMEAEFEILPTEKTQDEKDERISPGESKPDAKTNRVSP